VARGGPLRRARQLALECSSTALAHQAEAELRAGGGRPAPFELSGLASLTPSERHVVELAAQELTNRAIAQQTVGVEDQHPVAHAPGRAAGGRKSPRSQVRNRMVSSASPRPSGGRSGSRPAQPGHGGVFQLSLVDQPVEESPQRGEAPRMNESKRVRNGLDCEDGNEALVMAEDLGRPRVVKVKYVQSKTAAW
jgi:hypothetical protein